MSKKEIGLSKLFKKYLSVRSNKRVKDYLKNFLPEIVYRTMRLEDEPVTRRQVSIWLR